MISPVLSSLLSQLFKRVKEALVTVTQWMAGPLQLLLQQILSHTHRQSIETGSDDANEDASCCSSRLRFSE